MFKIETDSGTEYFDKEYNAFAYYDSYKLPKPNTYKYLHQNNGEEWVMIEGEFYNEELGKVQLK